MAAWWIKAVHASYTWLQVLQKGGFQNYKINLTVFLLFHSVYLPHTIKFQWLINYNGYNDYKVTVIKEQEIEKSGKTMYRFTQCLLKIGPDCISEYHFWQKFPGGTDWTPHERGLTSLHTLLEWCACLAVAAYFMDRTCYSETYRQTCILCSCQLLTMQTDSYNVMHISMIHVVRCSPYTLTKLIWHDLPS